MSGHSELAIAKPCHVCNGFEKGWLDVRLSEAAKLAEGGCERCQLILSAMERVLSEEERREKRANILARFKY